MSSSNPLALQAAATVLRLSLGVMWISHALLKLVVFTLPGSVQFFESHGLPGALVYPVVAAEIAGGVAMVLGIYARQVALLLTPILFGAAWVHLPNGWVFNTPGGGWEYPVFLVVASVVLWLLGDGVFVLRRSARFVPQA
jgi:putative oxidoreductase